MFHGPIDFTVGGAFLDILTLVVGFLSFRERQLDLRSAFFEIHPGRDDGHAFLDGGPEEFLNLMPVQEQLSFSDRVVIPDVSMRIRTDVNVMQPGFQRGFRGPDLDMGISHIGRLRTNAFDFDSGQDYAGLDELLEKIPSTCVWICGNEFLGSFSVFGHLVPSY